MSESVPPTFGRAVFIRVHRVAEIMGLSVRTVQSYCATGTIPATQVGRHWLVPVSYLRGLGR